MLIYWLVLMVLTGLSAVVWAMTGCWQYFAGMMLLNLGSALWALIWGSMAPREPNAQSVGHRINGWFRNHGGQLARTILAVLAVMLIVFALGYAVYNYGLPGCKLSKTCTTESASAVVGGLVAKSAVTSTNTQNGVGGGNQQIAELKPGEPSDWIHLDPANCSFHYRSIGSPNDLPTVETGRVSITKSDTTDFDIGPVDSLRFTLKNGGRVIVTQSCKK